MAPAMDILYTIMSILILKSGNDSTDMADNKHLPRSSPFSLCCKPGGLPPGGLPRSIVSCI